MSSRPHTALPTGTVTFLFTDIEGSTRQWEHEPAAMGDALRRHDEITRAVVEAAGGAVFKTVGDAFCTVFAAPGPAARAALDLQRRLREEAWPTAVPLRVRCALHTGECEERDHDYFGPTVNRTARLMAIGHGGQVLVSGVTAAALLAQERDAPALKDLGVHRLRDLGRAEHVFQLVDEGGPDEFAPLASLDNPDLPNNLPTLLSSFVGRDDELAEVRDLVAAHRLVTLTGAGGAGKTRLALQAAVELLERFPNGTWLVELASLRHGDQVVQAVSDTLSVSVPAGTSALIDLVEALEGRDLLLVLDNAEHLVDDVAHLTEAVLQGSAKVRVVVTSREPLGLDGEQVYRVPSLSVPEGDVESLDELEGYDAVTLFLNRAADADATFDDADANLVASVCRRLDGIPLALELAAARLSSMSLAQLSDRLDNRFRLLTGGRRTAMARQQTLQATVDWSYELLSEVERSLLRRVSVFAGGFDLEAAEAVGASEVIDELDVDNLLHALVAKSLVIADQDGPTVRFRMLETIRQYAAGELLRTGGEAEAAEVRDRHAAYFAALARAARAGLAGPDQPEWLHRLDRDIENLRAMIAHYAGEPAHTADLLAVLVALRLYTANRTTFDPLAALLEGLARDDQSDAALSAAANLMAAHFAFMFAWSGRTELASALPFAQRGVELAARAHDVDLEVWGSFIVGLLYALDEQADLARASLRAVLARVDEVADAGYRSRILCMIGSPPVNRPVGLSDAEGEDLVRRGLAAAYETGAPDVIATAEQAVADVEAERGDLVSARHRYEEALAGLQRIGSIGVLNSVRNNLASVLVAVGEYAGALDLVTEALRNRRRLGGPFRPGDYLRVAGCVASWAGQAVVAARLHGASDAYTGDALSRSTLWMASYEVRTERESLERIHEVLSEEAYQREYEAGRALSPDEIYDVVFALELSPSA